MKRIFTFLLLIPVFAFSQITPGRYMIKLAFNDKVIQSGATGGTRLTTIHPCPDPAVNCQNQIWEIKSVRGTPNIFTITKVQNRRCFTFKEQVNDVTKILEDVFMEPQKPQALIRNQSFYIQPDKDGNYTIQPQRAPEFSSRNDVYLAAKLNTINIDGGDVFFETKNQQTNPTSYSNSTNIFWQFIPVTTTSLVTVTPGTIQSPSVVVAPPSANKIEIDFKTGGDNLEPRGFQKNLQITIAIQNREPIVMTDVNKNQTWPNNSTRRVTVALPADINVADLRSISLLRTVVNSWNNVDAGIADNWNLDKITATAIIKTEGRMMRTLLLNKSGAPLFRFIYEKRNNTNPNEGIGTTYDFSLGYQNNPIATTPRGVTEINAIFGTGGDDLRGGNDNVDLAIKLRTTPARTVYLRNLNNKENWPNFSERTVRKPVVGAAFTFADIESIELRHTGGGGIFADNWQIDKFKLTMAINGEARVLVDKVDAPIHMFTGETRRKVFIVN